MSTVFIDNLSEDVWQFIDALDDPGARKAEIKENVALADRHYLGLSAEYPNGIRYVAPEAIDPAFVDYVNSMFSGIKPTILSPRIHRGQLSEDILADPRLLKELAVDKNMELISYCSSKPLYRLIDALKYDYGIKVKTPEAPLRQRWEQTVNTFGTKVGLRLALASETGILHEILPEGEIVQGKSEILTAVLRTLNHQRGAVIKTSKGHAGMGVVLITPDEVTRNRKNLKKYVLSRLAAANGFWDAFPAVVETYISTDAAVGGGFPNVECRITDRGEVEVLYVCGMCVRNGVFAGFEAYDGLLSADYKHRVLEVGETLGSLLAKKGYRGYFDIDFMADISGKLYISELNVRRTGGTWAISICKRLFGRAYGMGRYILTNLVAMPGIATKSFEEVRQALAPVLLNPNNGDEQGVILASGNLVTQGKLNYLLVAKDKSSAAKLERNIFSLL